MRGEEVELSALILYVISLKIFYAKKHIGVHHAWILSIKQKTVADLIERNYEIRIIIIILFVSIGLRCSEDSRWWGGSVLILFLVPNHDLSCSPKCLVLPTMKQS